MRSLSRAEAVFALCDEYAQVLQRLSEMPQVTENSELCQACQSLARRCMVWNNASYATALVSAALYTDINELRNQLLQAVWNEVQTNLNSCGLPANGMGKYRSGVQFSDNRALENYYELAMFYDVEPSLKNALSSFQGSGSYFNACFNMLMSMSILSDELNYDLASQEGDTGLFITCVADTEYYTEYLNASAS